MVLNFTRKKSSIHGWGLFADKFIPNGTLIEECTYISITDPSFNPRIIQPYSFPNPKGKGIILPLGYAPLLNSSPTPNCTYTTDDDFLKIFSIKDIEKGEELTLKYL